MTRFLLLLLTGLVMTGCGARGAPRPPSRVVEQPKPQPPPTEEAPAENSPDEETP